MLKMLCKYPGKLQVQLGLRLLFLTGVRAGELRLATHMVDALVLAPALGHFLLQPQLHSARDQKTQLSRGKASPHEVHEVQREALNV